jgi:hypothetical protein
MCVETVFGLMKSSRAIASCSSPSLSRRNTSSSRSVSRKEPRLPSTNLARPSERTSSLRTDRASFGGNAKADADGDVSGQEEYQDHGPAQPFNLHGNVLVVVCGADGTSATIFGQATIDGSGSHTYRIDVKDLGEPGKGADTYRMLVNAYDSGEQVLRGGNVQIHKS